MTIKISTYRKYIPLRLSFAISVNLTLIYFYATS